VIPSPAMSCPLTDDVTVIATAMEDLDEVERHRRIRLAGDKIIDLRAVFLREQADNLIRRATADR
jgi:hypothetical protein